MGTSASLQQEKATKKTSVNAHNVRERLRSEYGGEDLGPSQDATTLRMAEVPALLKARGAFMKSLKSNKRTKLESTNIVKKQVSMKGLSVRLPSHLHCLFVWCHFIFRSHHTPDQVQLEFATL